MCIQRVVLLIDYNKDYKLINKLDEIGLKWCDGKNFIRLEIISLNKFYFSLKTRNCNSHELYFSTSNIDIKDYIVLDAYRINIFLKCITNMKQLEDILTIFEPILEMMNMNKNKEGKIDMMVLN